MLNRPYSTNKHPWLDEHYCAVTINYAGTDYTGYSCCHPEDEEFYSNIVGFTIAHMRAAIEAYCCEKEKARTEYKILKHNYDLYVGNQELENETFLLAVTNAEKKYLKHKKQEKQMRKNLHEYLQNQQKVIDSLKRQRQAKSN